MTSPEDISKIYRNTHELTFDTFIRDTLAALGASPSAVDKWIPSRLNKESLSIADAATGQLTSDFIHVGERICQRQLLPGKELDKLQRLFMDGIHESLHWDKIRSIPMPHPHFDGKGVSLLGWCRDVLLESATQAFFGESLLKIDPNLTESFFKFDATSWKLNYGYPKVLSKDMCSARDTIIRALVTYFKIPRSERHGVSFLVNSLETEMRNLAIGDRDIAAIMMPVYWV